MLTDCEKSFVSCLANVALGGVLTSSQKNLEIQQKILEDM